MSELTAQRIALNEAFDALADALSHFADTLRQAAPAARLYLSDDEPPLEGQEAVDAALALYQRLFYRDGQMPQATERLTGLIAADEASLTAAAAVNDAKQAFRTARLDLIKAHPGEGTKAISGLATRQPALADALGRARRSRLHIRQTERLIPIAARGVAWVNFTWYTGGSIRRTTVAEVSEGLLRRPDDPGAAEDLDRLAGLSDDTPLARVLDSPPQRRANVHYHDRRAAMMSTPMPLLVPSDDVTTLVPVSLDSVAPPTATSRLARADTSVDDTRFLTTMPVYRYRRDPQAVRDAARRRRAEPLLEGLDSDTELRAELDEALDGDAGRIEAVLTAMKEAVVRHV